MRKDREVEAKRYKIPFLIGFECSKIDCSDGVQLCEHTKNH